MTYQFPQYSYCLTTLILCLQNLTGFAQSPDSLWRAIDQAQSDSQKVHALLAVHQHYFYTDSAQALLYLDSALKLSEALADKGLLFSCLNAQGRYYALNGQMEKAKMTIAAQKAFLPVAPGLMHSFLNTQGLIFYEEESFKEAFETHLAALEIGYELQDPKSQSLSQSNLGMVLWRMKDYEQALDYYQQALERLPLTDRAGRANILGNMGLIYKAQDQLEKALAVYQQAQGLFEQLGDQFQMSINLLNIGTLYHTQEKYREGLAAYKASFELSQALQDEIGIAYSKLGMGMAQCALSKKRKAIVALEAALTLSQKLSLASLRVDIFSSLADCYAQHGQHEQAYRYKLQQEQLKDSLDQQQHQQEIQQLAFKYEQQKNENKILLLSQENAENQQQLERRNFMLSLLVSGLILTIISSIFLLFLYRQKMHIQAQRQQFMLIGQTQEQERSRIAKDLHDSVGSMLAALRHKIDEINQKESPQSERLLKQIDETADEVRRIAHNMMPATLGRYGLHEALGQYMDTLNQQKDLSVDYHAFGLESRLDEALEINLYRIVQELIQNTLKHAKANHISLHINRHKDSLNLIFEDNGQGLPVEKGRLISGMGLENIAARVAAFKGKVQLDSNMKKGVHIIIHFPLS